MSTFIDKLAYIHLKNNKILVTLSQGKETWYIPGGKRELGETDEQALIREVKEELSVALNPHTIKQYGVFQAQAHGKPKKTIVRMTCYLADYQGELTASSEIGKFDFFEYNQKDQTSMVDQLIFDDLYQKELIK